MKVILAVVMVAICYGHIAYGIRAPTITVHPTDFINDRAISRGGSGDVIIPCLATGDGTITYSWRHNGAAIQLDSRVKLDGGNLTFTGIILSDAGTYTCLAANQFGTSMSREATLQIRFLEYLGGVSETFTKDINDNARLRCQISPKNSPRPNRIYWTDADGITVAESTHIALTVYDGDLVFIAGWPNNTGSYKCNTIFNSIDSNTGSSSETRYTGNSQYVNFTTATATSVALKIEVGPNATEAVLGQARVVLECVATGYPLPDIQWKKKSGTLPINRYAFEKFDRHLVLKQIQLADAGEYQCTAISGSSEVTASATLRVTTASQWITAITDTNQPVDSDFVWECSAKGSNIKYRWYMNGQLISSNTKYVLNANGSLTIRKLASSDTKVYTCIAYNDVSNVASSGYLNVTIAAPVFTLTPYTRTTLFQGQTSTIRCTVTGGPRPVMTYTKDGAFVDTLLYSKYTVQLNGNLIIHNVQPSDAGVYECTATNRLGSARASGEAVVVIATTFTTPVAATSVRRPKSFSLSCTVQKAASLSVALYWQRENVNISTSRATVATNGLTTTLTYSNTTLADTGTFSCVAATNVPYVGYVAKSSSAALTVNDVPNAPFNTAYSQLTESSVVISWQPGNPNNSPLLRFTILYQVNSITTWRLAEDYIPVSTTFRRVTLSPFNTYRFKVIAVNAVGTSPDSTILSFATAEAVPYFAPGEFRANGVADDPTAIDIRFTPLSREQQNDAGIDYRLYFRATGASSVWSIRDIGNSGYYRLTGLTTTTTYELQLQPRNNKGFGRERTAIITVTTGSLPPTTSPTNVQAYVIGTNSVKLTWTKIATPTTRATVAVGYRVRMLYRVSYSYITSYPSKIAAL